MSQLSVFFHREKQDIFHSAIAYLENVDIPNDKKAALVVEVMKLIHVAAGGVWTPALETGIMYAIDYVLADIRSWAKKQEQPSLGATPPDFTAPHYTSLDSAKSARAGLPTPDAVEVREITEGGTHADGSTWSVTYYRLWPVGIGPAPGQKVYP